MKQFLVYLFWPNPANATYGNPKAMLLLVVCGLFMVASVGIRLWRRRLPSGVLRRLSRSWATASLWFGITGLIMVVARAEQIQYLSMRFLWVLWLAFFLLYLVIQVRLYRARYYMVMPTVQSSDPRERYLPKRKR